jgi:hypothetical protein
MNLDSSTANTLSGFGRSRYRPAEPSVPPLAKRAKRSMVEADRFLECGGGVDGVGQPGGEGGDG